ncbi:MAG: bifunctional copper resistance protein CopD/cytochrome c oxidase assembly protein [Actinomycetota bacterium]|nr:bifunctional copper resistance protein CopD/cytochrome c oxidase assembly protein [Actinomycetota bacterium]
MAGVALAACTVAVVVGGAASALVTGIDDVGAVVRWGLPLLRVVHDLAASLTVGLLVVAALLLPGRTAPAAMLRAGRTAVASGVVWVVSGSLGVLLGFADAAGTPLDGPDYWSQLHTFIWTLESLRVGIISAGLAAVATVVAGVALSRKGLAAAAFLAIFAIVPLALAGHASGDADHETAVNALAAHLLGATLWVGGLLALLVLRPVLGRRLPVVVARYSTMALWCFVAVGISGVVSSLVKLGGLGNLFTAYGSLILVKTACLVVLGGFGLLQRRRVVARMTTDPAARGLFARFALAEVVVMGVAFGFATALARTETPAQSTLAPTTIAEGLTGFPEPAAPTAASLVTLWRWDWLWSVIPFIAVGLYLVWVVRMRRRGDHWPVSRTVAWVLGWAVFFYAACGAPAVLGRVSFSWHMIEHMVIAMGAPVLLVLAAPVTLALRALPARRDGSLGPRELLLGLTHSRLMRVVGNPVVAAALFFVSLAVFYYSPLFELALETHTGHVLMVAHFLVTGYLYAWVLIGVDPGPPKWAPPLRLLILLVTISFHAFFGVALMSATTLLAPGFFGRLGLPWVPDPLADQQRAGGIAWGIGEAPTLLLALLVVLAWIRSDAVETRRTDRQAARDGDAELTAYNAQLSALRDRDSTTRDT